MKSYLRLKARKRNLYELFYKKPEDRVTETFIKMLEKTKPSITADLLERLDIGEYDGEFKYELQVNRNITAGSSTSIVLGISDFKHDYKAPNKVESIYEKKGNPDAHIYASNDSIHILVEVKVNNNKLTDEQLRSHLNRFIVGVEQTNIEVVCISWCKIREELNELLKGYDECHRNYLLIHEFLDLIYPKEYKDIFDYPEHAGLKKAYYHFDEFILGLENVKPKIRANESIDYSCGIINFVSIYPKRNILILKPKDKEMQRKVNAYLNFNHFNEQERTDVNLEHTRCLSEAIINLNYIDDFSKVEELITSTYVSQTKNK